LLKIKKGQPLRPKMTSLNWSS